VLTTLRPAMPALLRKAPALWDSLRDERLQWLPELGLGYYPVTENPYVESYWQAYRTLDRAPSGIALTALRRVLVSAWWDGAVVDVGIGGGRFVIERPNTRGFDVNPAAIDWLQTRGLWCNAARESVDAMCFWDSLEHIHEPGALLANARRFVFVSCPIFTGPEHALRSKHYKPAEHCWYFTSPGLVGFMAGFDFEVVFEDRMEQTVGREDIGSFVFRRVGT